VTGTQLKTPAPPRLRFSLAPEPSRLLRARERIRDYLTAHCSDQTSVNDVVLAIEEACTNAIRHSGSGADIEIRLTFRGANLHVAVSDKGHAFDVASFDPQRPPDPLLDHGRGLFLISRLCDGLELRVNGGLDVRMVKRAALTLAEPAAFDHALAVDGGRPSGARQRAMLDEIAEGFEAFDWEYRYVYVNAVTLRRLGMTLDDVIGRTPWEAFPALEGSDLLEGYHEAMELGRPTVLEHRSVVDGQWLEVRIYPTSAGISCYYRGIDERRAADDALERSRRRTELLEWVAGSLLASDDPQGLVEELCRRVMAELDCQVFLNYVLEHGRLRLNASAGVTDDEAGSNAPSDSDACGCTADDARPVVFEDMPAGADRRAELPASWGLTAYACHPMLVLDEVLGTLSFGTTTRGRFSDDDLALMKAVAAHVAMAIHHWRAEGERRRYELLAAASRDIMLFMDREGRIIEANQAAETSYGYTRDELLALSIADLRAEETRAAIAPEMAEADEHGILFETVHRRKDGTVFPVEVSARGATIGGRRRLLSVVRDITARNQSTEERERRQRGIEADLVAMRRLQALGTRFVRQGDLQTLLEEIVDAGIAIAGSDFGNCQLLDEVSGSLQIVAHRGLPDWWLEFWRDVPYGSGCCGTALMNGERVVCEDVEQSPIFAGTPAMEVQLKAGVRAVISTPLKGRTGEPFGMISQHYRAPHKPDEQTLQLLDLLARQAADLIERAWVEEALRASEARQSSIAVALQDNFIHPLPDIAGWEFGTASKPASAAALIGGDFHDVFDVPRAGLAVLIGDVEGKGIKAAGLTETVRSAARGLALSAPTPRFVLERLNSLLLHDQSQLVTALFAYISRTSGVFQLGSAGHPPPLRVSEDGAVAALPLKPAPPLGGFAQIDYPVWTGQLAPGEALVLYTDGVTDARKDGRFFGEEGIVAALGDGVGLSARQLADRLLEAVSAYTDQLRDDVDILVIKRD